MPDTFWVIDTTFQKHNALHIRQNLWEEVQRVFMSINDRTRDEQLPHGINREAAKISALSSGKIDK